MQKKNITKLHSTSFTFGDNSFTSTQNALSFRRIMYRRPPPTTPQNDRSDVILNSICNDHMNDLLTRSILINNAAQRPGFLPYDYRLASTFESIRRERLHLRPLLKVPTTVTPRIFTQSPTRSDAFGNSTNTMSKLAEQRLILREHASRKKHNTSPATMDKNERSLLAIGDADFASDIPNALDLISQDKKRKSPMEQHLFETIKRERKRQARYRLLPINRAPCI